MAKTPKEQLALDLDEFQRRFTSLNHRLKRNASYRPISRPEIDSMLSELKKDVDFCFKRFLDTPDEVDHSAAEIANEFSKES